MSRDFASLHHDVVFGESGGQIIWQPRIGCWVTEGSAFPSPKKFAGEPFPPPFTGMDLYEIYRELDCSARLYEYNRCYKRIEHPAVEITAEALNETDTKTTIHTPVGDQVAVHRRTTSPLGHSRAGPWRRVLCFAFIEAPMWCCRAWAIANGMPTGREPLEEKSRAGGALSFYDDTSWSALGWLTRRISRRSWER